MLHVHNFIEHDGSLSRRDAIFNPANTFDPETFNNTISFYGSKQEIDIATQANARARHALEMSRLNPNTTITEGNIFPILSENAMMLAVWGHPDNPVMNRSFFEFFMSKHY